MRTGMCACGYRRSIRLFSYGKILCHEPISLHFAESKSRAGFPVTG
jgi:hypothetical protein